jgi:RNA polymerase sigma factor (sigma-70 family)
MSLSHFLRRVAVTQHASDRTDGELLAAFAVRRDEAAFEALVRRHGPMVLGVCLRVLGDPHDAEDAFQAVFLVLVKNANSVPPAAVGNWLYGVAYRTALNARRAVARRRARERAEEAMPHPTTLPVEDWTELRPILDAELSRLPDRYRAAVVLCDIEGLSRAEAARQLGVPEGTVSGRLTTARRRLADGLTRRGLTLSAVALAAILPPCATAAVPHPLLSLTMRAAGAWMAGTVGAISPRVITLANGVAHGLLLTKWKTFLLVAAMALPAAGAVTAALAGTRGAGTPDTSTASRPGKQDLTARGKSIAVEAGDSRRIERSFAVVEGQDLRIENLAGRVEIVPGTGSTIQVEATVWVGDLSAGEAARLRNAIRWTEVPTEDGSSRWGLAFPDGVCRTIRYPAAGEADPGVTAVRFLGREIGLSEHAGGSIPSVRFDLLIALPPGGRLAVHNAVGPIIARDVAARLRVSTTGGRISLQNVRSALDVSSDRGDIEIEGQDGDAIVTTGGKGNVRLANASAGRISLTTKAGSCRVVQPVSGGMSLQYAGDRPLATTSTRLKRLATTTGVRTGELVTLGSGGPHITVNTGTGVCEVVVEE